MQSNVFQALMKGLKFESMGVVCQIVVNLLRQEKSALQTFIQMSLGLNLGFNYSYYAQHITL